MKTLDQRAALDRFLKFITQREMVRRFKEAGGSRPYAVTGLYGKILNEWRFCNVNREDDRVTKWIAKHLRTEKDPRTLVMKLAVGRFINWPETLEHLLDDDVFRGGWYADQFLRTMDERMHMPGNKVYTGAYMIRAGTGDDAKMPKHEYLVKRVFDPLWATLQGIEHVVENRCETWDEVLGSIFGMGDFMRNQIITDMKYTYLLPRKKTPDWMTFCLAGPGTNRGMNRFDGSPLKRVRRSDEANEQLSKIRGDVLARLLADLPQDSHRWWLDTFSDLNNLSNCFCEWDKAERVRLGEGTPRSRYTPTKD